MLKLAVAIIGLVGGVVALATAVVSRRKEVTNRHEYVHRQQGMPTAPGSVARFQCPKCGSADLQRRRAVYRTSNKLILIALFILPAMVVLWAFYAKSNREHGADQNPFAILAVLSFALSPWLICWQLMRSAILQCKDCESKVPASEARAEPGVAPDPAGM